MAQNEVERDFQRPIKPLKHNVKDYDCIIVGTPTWWYKMSSPVLTFLSTNDFHGKVVVPFMTNNTHNDGTTTGMATSEKELDNWINSLK